jgi:hypothetical protein
MLFNLGNAISGPPTNKGNKKLPNPPIIAGITMKNIITIACAVIILLYSWLSAMYCTPGPDNSNLIRTEKAVPINPENNAKIRYNVPISFALLERNQRSPHIEISDFFISFIKPDTGLISFCHSFKYPDSINLYIVG